MGAAFPLRESGLRNSWCVQTRTLRRRVVCVSTHPANSVRIAPAVFCVAQNTATHNLG